MPCAHYTSAVCNEYTALHDVAVYKIERFVGNGVVIFVYCCFYVTLTTKRIRGSLPQGDGMKAVRRKRAFIKKVEPKFCVGMLVMGKNVAGEPIDGKVVGTLDHSVTVESGGVRHRCYYSALETVPSTEQKTSR